MRRKDVARDIDAECRATSHKGKRKKRKRTSDSTIGSYMRSKEIRTRTGCSSGDDVEALKHAHTHTAHDGSILRRFPSFFEMNSSTLFLWTSVCVRVVHLPLGPCFVALVVHRLNSTQNYQREMGGRSIQRYNKKKNEEREEKNQKKCAAMRKKEKERKRKKKLREAVHHQIPAHHHTQTHTDAQKKARLYNSETCIVDKKLSTRSKVARMPTASRSL